MDGWGGVVRVLVADGPSYHHREKELRRRRIKHNRASMDLSTHTWHAERFQAVVCRGRVHVRNLERAAATS